MFLFSGLYLLVHFTSQRMCRYWMSCFSKEENRVRARELLIQRVQEEMEDKQTETPQRKTSSSSMSGEEESWEQLAKRRRMERQQEVRQLARSFSLGSFLLS